MGVAGVTGIFFAVRPRGDNGDVDLFHELIEFIAREDKATHGK